jgi:CPA2 family monovalent cation:H+ antiporter-2
MHDIDLILTLTGGLAAALVCGYITFRLGLSPIVGYLLAGLVVGPNTPGFTANTELADQLAEIGVILLMFGVGLQFHLDELLAVWRVAVPGAVIQSLVATVLGTLVGIGFGWTMSAGIVFGLAISVASTVVLMRVLVDNHDLHTPAGHIAVGWLVVEDLFTVLVLVLLPSMFQPGTGGAMGLMLAVGVALAKLGAMSLLTFGLGEHVIPWALDRVAATRSRELFTLTVLVVALGIAVGSAKLFGASMALGAFLAGMVVGRSEFSLRAATEALPMRDAFAVLFFVSVGILFDPKHLMHSPGLIAATLAVILVGKPLAALSIVLLLKYPLRVAVAVSVVLAQIGEFSFILATAAKGLGILDNQASNTLIAASIASITLSPVLYRFIGPIEVLLRRVLPVSWYASQSVSPSQSHGKSETDGDSSRVSEHTAIVVGYGPVGRTVARLLQTNRVEPVVIELNLETVRTLTSQGIRAVYGDSSHRETLIGAGIESAVALILSSSDTQGSREAIRLARELNPRIIIFARAAYLRELPAIQHAGADIVFSGEGEVALSMTEFILRELGATPEQIDRERARIRTDLFGDQKRLGIPTEDRAWPPMEPEPARATAGLPPGSPVDGGETETSSA